MYIPVTAARSPYHCCCPLSLLLPVLLTIAAALCPCCRCPSPFQTYIQIYKYTKKSNI